MSSSDIFNPDTQWTEALGFNTNWNYGSARKTAANYSINRPRWGQWQSRSIGGAGYSFDMIFVDRPMAQVLYIKRFYEQFQQGFFTVIDYDNGSREHVGRFTTYSDDTHTANNKFTVRVLFEEIPNCPMRNYPSDWANSSHPIYVLTDSLYQAVAVSSTVPAAWVATQTPAAVAAAASVNDPASYEILNANPAAGDFAQVEYVGWGFQMQLRQAANLGICNVFLDGVQIVTGLDFSNGTATALAGPVLAAGLLSMPSVSLGRHRVKIVATATKNAAATATSVYFPAIQVMH